MSTKASKSWWKFWSSDRAQALREEVIELEAKKKFLQEEMENRLSEQKRMFEQQLHEVKLANKAKDSDFEVKQKEWQQEKDRLIKLNQEDREIYEKRLKEELDFKHKEATALLKLESDQRIKQAEIDAERKVLKAEQEADKKLTEETKKLRDGTYQQLSSELAKMHSEGNIASKNQHEAMMKLLDAGVAMRANVNLNGNMQIPTGQMKDAIRDGVSEVVNGVKN